METVAAYDVKTHLSQFLRRVEKGESFTFTTNGVPVAKLVPIEQTPQPDVPQAIEDILKFRKTHSLGGFSIKELINEGRRI